MDRLQDKVDLPVVPKRKEKSRPTLAKAREPKWAAKVRLAAEEAAQKELARLDGAGAGDASAHIAFLRAYRAAELVLPTTTTSAGGGGIDTADGGGWWHLQPEGPTRAGSRCARQTKKRGRRPGEKRRCRR